MWVSSYVYGAVARQLRRLLRVDAWANPGADPRDTRPGGGMAHPRERMHLVEHACLALGSVRVCQEPWQVE